MSNNANLYNKNFNIVETKNSFKDIYMAYKENDNKNIVDELKGSIIISLTNDKNEIILCSDELYNLSPRFIDPISSIINNDNIITVRLNYNSKYFNLKDSKLELNNDIINEIEKIEKLENEVKNLKDDIEDLKNIINSLTNQDSNSTPANPEDQLENENNKG